MTKQIPYIETKGTNYQIGCAVGEHLREKIRACNERMKEFCSDITKGSGYDLNELAKKTEQLTKKYFPNYLKELEGMADGALLSLEDLLLFNDEETIFKTVKKSCTTIAYSCGDGILLGHNEDWAPGYEEDTYVIKAKPKKGAPFLSLAYIGSLPGSSVALNSCGIAFSGNSILKGIQEGVPKNIILRSQIEAKTLEAFEKLASFPYRAIPNHTLAIDKKGRIISVELALDRSRAVYTSGFFAHTNHAIHQGIAELDPEPRKDSAVRYKTTLKHLFKNEATLNLMKNILRDHENDPCSICVHAKTKDYQAYQTIASAIVDVTEMSMSVVQGNPCKSEYKKYHL